ncbi:MAG TPA: four helix bundle protein [Balneolaceae bacterium]|nr:four helix bundle protein [Balneolaceae bacterium]
MSDKIEKFEDLNVWKEAMKLTVQIYKELENCKDFGLRDQIQRAAVSVPSNIAEGYERNSNKNFIRFLYIAKSSTGEVRTQLYLCQTIGLIPKGRCSQLIELTKKISAMLFQFIKVRRERF